MAFINVCLFLVATVPALTWGQYDMSQVLHNHKYRDCLSATGRENGTPLKLDKCDVTSDYQRFDTRLMAYPAPDTNGFILRFRNIKNKVLDVPGAATGNGVKVDIWDLVDGAMHLVWVKYGSKGDDKGNERYMLKNYKTGKCLTAEAGGAYIDQWDCVGAEHQYWGQYPGY